MTATLHDMPKKTKGSASPKPKYPSREKLKYVGIPKEFWELVYGMTEDGEKYEGRSIAYLVKIAVRTFLQSEGKVDAKGRPVVQPP